MHVRMPLSQMKDVISSPSSSIPKSRTRNTEWKSLSGSLRSAMRRRGPWRVTARRSQSRSKRGRGTDRVQGLLIDTGLMRKNEVALVKEAFDTLGIKNLRVEDASEEFFANLKGVYDHEKKRQIIGQTFLDVQKRVSEEMGLFAKHGWLLGQGTTYPDIIETGATKHADRIKTHHNRIEAVQKMIEAGSVIEPLKDLYKDEVRKLGEELGLPHEFVWRHPFPGPGLGVRILCAEKESYPPFKALKTEGLP